MKDEIKQEVIRQAKALRVKCNAILFRDMTEQERLQLMMDEQLTNQQFLQCIKGNE
jgi:hypothetical protein